MDYTYVGWQEAAPPYVSGGNLLKMDQGIMDAHNDQEYGTFATMPPASAAKKNHIYWAWDTGERFKCDGTQWLPLTVGNAGLQDGAVSLAKLGAGVTAQLPSTSEKASFPGIGGMQNFLPVGYNNSGQPGSANKVLLQGAVRSFWVDHPGGGASIDVFETGLWLVNSVYGFQDDALTTRCSLAMMTYSTGGEGLRTCVILATGGYTRNVTVTHNAFNPDTTTGALRITASHGNTRTFFRSLRADMSGGSNPKGA
jgi:hypothetical protein